MIKTTKALNSSSVDSKQDPATVKRRYDESANDMEEENDGKTSEKFEPTNYNCSTKFGSDTQENPSTKVKNEIVKKQCIKVDLDSKEIIWDSYSSVQTKNNPKNSCKLRSANLI